MSSRALVIAVEGPSAAGKSAVVTEAAAQFGWVPLNEAFDRLDPPPSLRYSSPRQLFAIERRLLLEEGQRFREARRWRGRGRTVLADTGFLGPITYTAGLVAIGRAPIEVLAGVRGLAEKLAARRSWGLPDAIVYLVTSERARARRAERDRRGHPVEFRARHEAVGHFERALYLRWLPSILPGRVRSISGQGRPGVVAHRILDTVPNFPPAPVRPTAVREVLDCLEARPSRRLLGNR